MRLQVKRCTLCLISQCTVDQIITLKKNKNLNPQLQSQSQAVCSLSGFLLGFTVTGSWTWIKFYYKLLWVYIKRNGHRQKKERGENGREKVEKGLKGREGEGQRKRHGESMESAERDETKPKNRQRTWAFITATVIASLGRLGLWTNFKKLHSNCITANCISFSQVTHNSDFRVIQIRGKKTY